MFGSISRAATTVATGLSSLLKRIKEDTCSMSEVSDALTAWQDLTRPAKELASTFKVVKTNTKGKVRRVYWNRQNKHWPFCKAGCNRKARQPTGRSGLCQPCFDSIPRNSKDKSSLVESEGEEASEEGEEERDPKRPRSSGTKAGYSRGGKAHLLDVEDSVADAFEGLEPAMAQVDTGLSRLLGRTKAGTCTMFEVTDALTALQKWIGPAKEIADEFEVVEATAKAGGHRVYWSKRNKNWRRCTEEGCNKPARRAIGRAGAVCRKHYKEKQKKRGGKATWSSSEASEQEKGKQKA
jgi:hypothetical protein